MRRMLISSTHSKKKKKSKSSSSKKLREEDGAGESAGSGKERSESPVVGSSGAGPAGSHKTEAQRRFEEVQRKRVRRIFRFLHVGVVPARQFSSTFRSLYRLSTRFVPPRLRYEAGVEHENRR